MSQQKHFLIDFKDIFTITCLKGCLKNIFRLLLKYQKKTPLHQPNHSTSSKIMMNENPRSARKKADATCKKLRPLFLSNGPNHRP